VESENATILHESNGEIGGIDTEEYRKKARKKERESKEESFLFLLAKKRIRFVSRARVQQISLQEYFASMSNSS
jgi:hypothetical protein